LTENDAVCAGFNVTVAGVMLCASETAAIKRRIAVVMSPYMVRIGSICRLHINRSIVTNGLCPVFPNRSLVYT
jgi:hypothetical protein